MPCENCSKNYPGAYVKVIGDMDYCAVCSELLAAVKPIIDTDDKILLHCRALCAHAECLGLNARNTFCVMEGKSPDFAFGHFLEVLRKWDLINEEGKPNF